MSDPENLKPVLKSKGGIENSGKNNNEALAIFRHVTTHRLSNCVFTNHLF